MKLVVVPGAGLPVPFGPPTTQRLWFDPVTAAHADEVFPVVSDPRIYTYLPEQPPSSVDALRKRYEFLSRRKSPDGTEIWLNWILRLRETNDPIGFYQATVRAASCSIAYGIHPKHWRRGYATEASHTIITHLFETYGVASVTTEISVRNEASIRLVKRLGFSFVRHDPAERDDIHEIVRSAWIARHETR